ncbi:glycosyltransferase family 2 protein [Nocardioides cynanchi]|uniref:glycosyltransferase family 2 protein n=1 Tax=Nocardioides cynanchi TaxID=2558918 RepID=UPI001247FBC9|nr:glycosyltransferase family 2 protein [Nocardioides cynanchi]
MEESAVCDLVLPCRDEAGALPALLAEVPHGFAVIVVDNGSTDGTAGVARACGARVVTEPRPGYGAAVHAGVEAATSEWVAVMDGDGSFDPAELPQLLAAVTSGRCDLALGRRRPVARGVWPWHARAGNAAVVWWLRRSVGFPVHDLAPMRVCRRRDLLDLAVADRRFGYPLELLRKATLAGWRLTEYDVSYRPRAAGTTSKVSGSLRGTTRTARDFWKVLATAEVETS